MQLSLRKGENAMEYEKNRFINNVYALTAKQGLKNLKGHRSVGGMRASIYNAMPIEGVEKLVSFMKVFAKENPKKD